MKKLGWWVLLAFCGCKGLFDPPPPKVMVSAEKDLQLTVPGRWKVDNTLNVNAELQAADRFNELYVMVLSELKDDFADPSLEAYAQTSLKLQTETMTGVSHLEPQQRTVGGLPALQHELRGASGGVNVVMVQTAVEGAERFHLIKAWTLKSKWEKEQQGLQGVVDSLRELPRRHPKPRSAAADEGSPKLVGTFKSADGAIQLQTPDGWKKNPSLNDGAQLAIDSKAAGTYLIVISEPKEDLFQTDLAKFSEITRNHQLESMEETSVKGPEKRVISGQPAIVYELFGVVSGSKVAMLHTVIEGDQSFHQVLAWTVQSRWRGQRQTLQEVTDSFRERKINAGR